MNLPFLKSAPGLEPVVVEGVFAAPVERVYRAWTDPDELKAWFGLERHSLVSAEVDLRVGGRWRFVVSESEHERTSLHGEYLEIEPNARLAFSWRFLRENADGIREETGTSRVTVTFEAHGASTRVHLSHEGIATEDGRLGVGQGWNASLANLAASLAAA